MAVRNGWNALTLDNAGHSEDIHFAGGRMALAGAKISSGNTYEVQIKLPNGDWTDTYMATVNQTNPMRSNVLPAGVYRVDQATGSETDVLLYWAYVPGTMHDAAIY